MRATTSDAKRGDDRRSGRDERDHRVTLSLPKGGGAIRSIGEKFAMSPATGTATLTLPVPVTAGRALSPSPALAYDSGRGNGPFGLGWDLPLPRITRKTDKRLPQYRDDLDSDTFVMSDAEDLAPLLVKRGGLWEPVADGVTEGTTTYHVRRYRPRIDAAFARIERWTDVDSGVMHWRVIDRANLTSRYGMTSRGRVTDPADPRRTAQWLLEEQADDRGNIVVYRWLPEDDRGVDVARPEERNRARGELPGRVLKEIAWANAAPDVRSGFHFRLVLDYGDHDVAAPTPAPSRPWRARDDAFSRFKTGFEVRSHRLCDRLLVFHDFPELGGARLVKSLDLTYGQDPAGAKLVRAVACGYAPDGAGYRRATTPALELAYTEALPASDVRVLDAATARHLPVGLASGYQLVDLDGEGLAGILSDQGEGWFYRRNLGGGRFSAAELVVPRPTRGAGPLQLADLDGDGQQALVSWRDEIPGYYARTEDGGWSPFMPFASRPTAEHDAKNARFLDLDGDGRPDLIVTEDQAFRWYPSLGRTGFDAPRTGDAMALDEEVGPRLVFAGGDGSIFLADMSGDGLVDLVRVRNGEVCYWPNLGYGRFGAKVAMDGAPVLDHPDHFDPARVRLADIDGSGTSDLLYIGRDAVTTWTNASGNRFGAPRTLPTLPHTDRPADISVVDLLGDGTSCLVWSSTLPADAASALRYVELTGGKKPHLLAQIMNGVGGEVNLTYAPSTRFYRDDADAGHPWATRLPFPVQCLARVERLDHVARTRTVTEMSYHHGHYDGEEREFRGFARVDQRDAESFGAARGAGLYGDVLADPAEELRQPPVLTRTWFHTGALRPGRAITNAFEAERFADDPAAMRPPATELPADLLLDEERHAARALKGRQLRSEVFALDGGPLEALPYRVSESSWVVRLLQPAAREAPPCFLVHDGDTIEHHYERVANDPRISHTLTLAVDPFGNATHTARVVYPRRDVPGRSAEQEVATVLVTHATFANRDDQPWLRLGVPVETSVHELGIDATTQRVAADLLAAWIAAGEIPFEQAPAAGEKRLISRSRVLYRGDDLAGPLDVAVIESRALVWETRQLAFTPGLLATFGGEVDAAVLTAAGYVLDGGVWWSRSGRDEYAADAAAHFYLPSGFRDPFENVFVVGYDPHDLRPVHTDDPAGNAVDARLDYRVLQVDLVTDTNQNRAQAAFDALGRVAGTAVMGKTTETLGDSLAGFVADLPDAVALAHLNDPLTDPGAIIGAATTRVLYDIDRWTRAGEPPAAYTITRERHVSDPGVAASRLGHAFVYWDGEGREVMRKVQAEPDEATPTTPRWVGTGRTSRDNKGNPVKQYEPFFSATHAFEDEPELVATGFSVIRRYDPVGRLVATEHPDGTIARVSFGAWRQEHADQNDLVDGSAWQAERMLLPALHRDRVAADRTLAHAGSPLVHQLDAMGRAYAIVADNRTRGLVTTRTQFDAEGNAVMTTDDRGNATVRTYAPQQRVLREDNPDAGIRRTFADAAGDPCLSWNGRGIRVRMTYDDVHRRRDVLVRRGGSEIVVERLVYGDSAETGLTAEQRVAANLRGHVYRAHDGAGTVTHTSYDFEGRLLVSERRVSVTVDGALDWSARVPPALEAPLAVERAWDARGRVRLVTLPDATRIRTEYNEAGLLETVHVAAGGGAERPYVTGVVYDAKGQRRTIRYGNGVVTETTHDPRTWRLTSLVTTRGGAGPELQRLEYTYDATGNVIRVTDGAQQDIYFANAVASATGDYTYDALYRLIEAHGREHRGLAVADDGLRPHYDRNDVPRLALAHPNDGAQMVAYTETYEHDAVGNLTRVAHAGATTFTRRYQLATGSNRIESTALPGDPSTGVLPVRYDHDDDGNITRMPHLSRLEWDHAQRLSEAALDLARVARYRYDGNGQRVRKAIVSGGAIVEERIYLDGYELRRARGSTLRTVHVSDGMRRIALIEIEDTAAPVIRYQLGNHLDSATLELDGAGAIISYEEFYPYGGTSLQQGPGVEVRSKRYRYLARERDDETGLLHCGARYVAPWLGRWLSPDPAGPVDGTNLYAYSRGSPVRLRDPSGTSGEDFQLPVPDILRPLSTTDRLAARAAGALSPGTLRFRTASEPAIVPGLVPRPSDPVVARPAPTHTEGTEAARPEPTGPVVTTRFQALLPEFHLTVGPRVEGTAPRFHVDITTSSTSVALSHLPHSADPEASVRLGYSYGAHISLDSGTAATGINFGYDPHADRVRVQFRHTPAPGIRFEFSAQTPGATDAGIPSFSASFTFGSVPLSMPERPLRSAVDTATRITADPGRFLNGVGSVLRGGSLGYTPPLDFGSFGTTGSAAARLYSAAESSVRPQIRGTVGVTYGPWRPEGAPPSIVPLPDFRIQAGLQIVYY